MRETMRCNSWTFPLLVIGLVIVRGAKTYSNSEYNAKLAEETEHELSQLLQSPGDEPVVPSPSTDQHEWQSSSWGQQQPTPKSRSWFDTSRSTSSEREDPARNMCPPRYEEIVGYCADSPIGNPLAFSRYRCASQCTMNHDCLGFSFDKEADGKSKPFTCTLQHTECRFPTYSTRFGFCRKKLDKSHKPHHPPPYPAPFEVPPPFDLPPIRISEEPNTEILRAYMSTYDQICDSDKHFKTSTVFTCAQYCLADAGCQAFSYDQAIHVCRFIGHCQQKQVFKKLFGSSGMPDILSLLNFILSRAAMPSGLMGVGSVPPGILAAAAAGVAPPYSVPPTPRGPPPPTIPMMPSMMPPLMPPYKSGYTSSEERYIMNRRDQADYRGHRHHGRYDFDRSFSEEHRVLHGYERMDGDCQTALLENKVYELNAYECARKCHRRPDCAGFSVNLYVSSPHECYLRAESCSAPTTSSAWVYFRRLEQLRVVPSPSGMPPPSNTPSQNEEISQQPLAKSEKLYGFNDYMRNNLNRSSQQQSMRMKLRARKNYANEQTMMTIARRSLTSPTMMSSMVADDEIKRSYNKSSKPIESANQSPANKSSQEKVLQYYIPLPGNCKGSVIEQMESTIGECAIRCIQTAKCLGFAFDEWDNKCYIKSNKCLNPEPSPNGVVYYQLRM